MSTDPNNPQPPTAGALPVSSHGKGVKVFTYPKIIFIWPTLLASLVCGFGMIFISDRTHDPSKAPAADAPPASAAAGKAGMPAEARDKDRAKDWTPVAQAPGATAAAPTRRFLSTQNILAVSFLLIFFTNMIIMAIDFPRFTVFGIFLVGIIIALAVALLNEHFQVLPVLVNTLEGIYAVANAQFYFIIAIIIGVTFLIIYATRFLDYWVILPNEILHNHGPFSDLERYPTFNLKFDKEIPDILEYMLGLQAGRLVLHVASERKAIVLDTVLFIDRKEAELKKLMSRMEVRVTTDQETAEPS